MANLSMQLQKPLSCDTVKREVVNDEEATKLLQRNYRGPWMHPLSGNI